MIVDVLPALITYLGSISDMADLVSARIYGGEIPDSEIENMPRKLTVLRYAGGPESFRSDPVQRQRIDVFSYGETYFEAGRVDRTVADAWHDLTRVDVSNVLIHSVGYGGAQQLKEPDTGWPYLLRSAIVISDERVTA